MENKEQLTKNKCSRKHYLVKFIKTKLLYKTKYFPSNTNQKFKFIKHKMTDYFNFFYLYMNYPICYLFFLYVFFVYLAKLSFTIGVERQVQRRAKSASVNETTLRVRCNVCSAATKSKNVKKA